MKSEFTKLLKENQGIVYKICNIYFNNRAEKEDYVQEIIIRIWKAYSNFKGQSKFSTWMYKVALNSAIDLLRQERTYPRLVSLSQNEFELYDVQTENSTKQDKLYQAINQLSEIEKAIIILYLEDYSYKEIAGIMGISETYTGVKINRIKTELQKRIIYGN